MGRALIVAGVLVALMAGPALAAEGDEAQIDVTPFITRGTFIGDPNGDGVPDLGVLLGAETEDDEIDLTDLEEGIPGIWDDLIGATTPEEFEDMILPQIPIFDVDDEGSMLVGPCGGLAVSYDERGWSVDAMIDLSDGNPPVDVFTGDQAMTADNPFRIDPAGLIVYWGRTKDVPTFSLAGQIEGVNYGDPAPAFHDHSWAMYIMGISADTGGDPNQRDKNRNAGVVELGKILGDVDAGPIDLTELRAKIKARGAIVDLYATSLAGNPLPEDVDKDNIFGIAAMREYCYGEGWVEFIGSGPPMTATAIASVLAAAGFAGLLFNVRPAQSWRA